MPGLRNNSSNGAMLRVGVVTAAEVNQPTSAAASTYPLIDTDSATTWSVILFVAAVVMLYFVL